MPSTSPERLRLQKKAVGRLHALKQSNDAEDYYAACKQMSIASGLGYNEVRAVAWRDLVLGVGVTRSVPYLSDTMIVVHRPVAPRAAAQDRCGGSGVGPTSKLAHDDSDSAGGYIARPPRKTVSVLSQRVKSDAAPSLETSSVGTSTPDSPGGLTKTTSSALSSSGAAGWRQGRQRSPVRSLMTTTQPMKLPDNCQPKVVEADIERSLWNLYPEVTQRTRMRKQLKTMILRILAFRRDRHYYQGLHEVMGFVMSVMVPYVADDVIVSVCEKLLITRWAAFSEPTLSKSQALLYAVHAIIAEEDPNLATALEACGVGPESHYAVSWVITWYTHCIKDADRLGRLVDYFIADEDPWNVIFFTASFILAEKEQVLTWLEEAKAELGPEADSLMLMARVYALLVKLPEMFLEGMTTAEVDLLIVRAADFRGCYLSLVTQESENFMAGEVRHLGMLANQRTRNAALRLLWRLLPREWRNPTARRGLQKIVLWSGVLLTATIGVLAASSHLTGSPGAGGGGSVGRG